MSSRKKKNTSVGFVQVYESRRKDRPPTGGEKKKKKKKRKKKKERTAGLYGLWDPLPPRSSEFSADNSPMRREGHSSTSLVSYSWWRVSKSMWRANEQESRARFGLWKEKREI